MNMKYLILVVLTLLTFTAQAQKVYVSNVSGEGLKASEAFSIKELIKSAVSEVEEYETTDNKEEATTTLSPTLLSLGDTYFLKITNKTPGKKTRSLKMKSDDLEDIDRVVDRLVKAILGNKTLSETSDVTNVTYNERNQNTVRMEVTRQWIFGFGPGWLANSNTSKSGFYYLLGYQWGLDPNFSLKLLLDGTSYSDSSASFSQFGLGLDYSLSKGKTSPYVGMGVGRGSADVHGCDRLVFDMCEGNEEASGWALSTNIGVKFFRTSTVNLGVELKHSIIFDKNYLGRPQRYTLSLAAYY